MTNPLLPPAARSAGRIFLWVLAAVAIIGVLCAVWLGVRGYLAYGHLRDAEQTARDMREQITDAEATTANASDLAEDTAAAHRLTSDPVWRAAELLPWVGDQMNAVAEATAAVDDVASTALEPLIEVAQDFSVDDLRPTDGRIDVSGLAGLHDVAVTSAERVSAATARVDAIDRRPLLGPVAERIDGLADQLRAAGTGADAVSRASVLAPAMLGQDGPREYLLVFQNNAEWRSLGGIVGATALLRTDGGALSLEDQVPASTFPRHEPPISGLSPEQAALFDDQPGRFIANVTQVPDFTVTAKLVQQMWEEQTGQHVDGVISVDPVALAELLRATGPITLPTGDVVDSDNAVQLLLNEVYLRFAEPREQDEFFQDTTNAVFDSLISGAVEPGELIRALSSAASERRILIWNEHETDQTVLDGTPLQGAPMNDDESTRFGVFLNDGTASKMNYYTRVESGASWCSAGSDTSAVLEVNLRSDAPEDAANLPRAIAGGGSVAPPGISRVVTYLYLPEGAEIISATNSDGAGFGRGTDAGRPVLTWETNLAPGDEMTARIEVSTPYGNRLDVVTTPTVTGAAETITPPCGTTRAN